MKLLNSKYRIIFAALPIAIAAIVAKLLSHWLGWDIVVISPLYTSLVAATVLLLGFLIAGTLPDFEESERLPGGIVASLDAILDECSILYEDKKSKQAVEAVKYVGEVTANLKLWLGEKRSTQEIFKDIAGLNHHFLQFEPLTQPNFIVRLKQEQANLRRMVIRIHSIREESFVPSGHAIAEGAAIFLVGGLVFIKIEPFYESLFLIGFITFLLASMTSLIKDLGNPFDYSGKGSEEVSLEPLDDLLGRIKNQLADMGVRT